jgi:hypothetical protein
VASQHLQRVREKRKQDVLAADAGDTGEPTAKKHKSTAAKKEDQLKAEKWANSILID